MQKSKQVAPAAIDPGAGAVLWTATYMAHHTSTERDVKEGMLAASRRYFRFAPQGGLRDAAVKRKHTDRSLP